MKVEKTVYLVRHGQSEGNVGGVYQTEDSPLSGKGKEQAQEIAERVSKLDFEKLISSPYPRARETARVIENKLGIEAEESMLFVERKKPKSIDGKPHTDKAAGVVWREWEKSLRSEGLKVEDGNNYGEMVTRADKALEYLLQRPEEKMVVVTHGFFTRILVARVLLGKALTPELFAQFDHIVAPQNTALTVLRYKDAFEQESCWRLWIYNDHAHLG